MLRKTICIDNYTESSETLIGKGFFQSLSESQEHLLPDTKLNKAGKICTENSKDHTAAEPNYLLFQRNSIQWYNARKDSVEYEGVIREKFISCEGWYWIQK